MPIRLPIHLMIPAFNEAPVIAQVIAEIKEVVDCPITVIDDGSHDDTAQIAIQCGVSVIRHPVNRGAGAACMTGIALARANGWKCIVFMDADGQHIPSDILVVHETYLKNTASIIVGSRFLQHNNDIPVLRQFFNSAANVLTNFFCEENYTDTQSGFRLLGEAAIQQIDLVQDDFSYCSEMIIQADRLNLQIMECFIGVRYTDYSVSKGQDFQVGLLTAFHFLWKLLFK